MEPSIHTLAFPPNAALFLSIDCLNIIVLYQVFHRHSFLSSCAVHPTFRELKDRTVPNMSLITWYTIGGAGALYLTCAVAGYLLFGEDTAVDVLVNFNSRALNDSSTLFTVTSVIAQSLYFIHMITVLPVIFFPLRLACNDLLFQNSQRALDQDRPRFLALTAILLLIMFGFSVFIPNLWLAFNLLGATATLLIGFAFPALLALR